VGRELATMIYTDLERRSVEYAELRAQLKTVGGELEQAHAALLDVLKRAEASRRWPRDFWDR